MSHVVAARAPDRRSHAWRYTVAVPPVPPAADPAGLLGRTLGGRYRLTEHIGSGDLGHVYRAEQVALRKVCVIKVLRPEVQQDPPWRQQVLRGTQQVAQLPFDWLVRPDDVLVSDVEMAIVSPILGGEDLSSLLRRMYGRLPWAHAREILQQIGAALVELHAAGVMFGGLKPRNVFLARNSDGVTQVRLLDVGTSRHSPTTASVAYMAPEWAAGAVPDVSADIYSLGSLAYEMLTAHALFSGAPAQVALMHRFKPPRPPHSIAPDAAIPPQIEAMILRALAKSPQDRPDIQAFLAAVQTTGSTVAAAAAPRANAAADPDADMRTLAGDMVFQPGAASVSFRTAHAMPDSAARSGELADDDQFSVLGARAHRTQELPPVEVPRIAPAEHHDDDPDEYDVPRTIMTSVPNFGAPPPGTTPTAMLGAPQQTVALGQAPAIGAGEPDDGAPRTMMVAGFGGSLLLEGEQVPTLRAVATPAVVPAIATPARPGLLQRLRLRRAPPAPGTPAKPGLLARFRGKPATTLPARRGPNWLDRSLRAIGKIPGYFGKLWRAALKPFGRASGLRSRLAAPFMSLRMIFSRITRMLSRWTGGAGE